MNTNKTLTMRTTTRIMMMTSNRRAFATRQFLCALLCLTTTHWPTQMHAQALSPAIPGEYIVVLIPSARGNDDNGHGSHVAGIAAALDNGIGVVGVAPGARLWAVKVLDNTGSGTMSLVAAGIDYVTQHAGEIEVANLSLGAYSPQTDSLRL